ncbi:hypothetical protein FNV43_RR27160 [Rhamnella rubrinervis]|uniref:Uncharacterized protein n=1 Tax=Rhamnella rubrinervis TaxID=2594499 RepID=A0A8K0DRA5_9ROSA|nr:hypothetical protein FNV43_RR27160 [Rhamnella rubrinervis]
MISIFALDMKDVSKVEEGFGFSGDTIQTIAKGIDFRFQDIQKLFYVKKEALVLIILECKDLEFQRWICENTELSKPMFDYWKKKCLVQVRQLDDSLAQAMLVASSPEEWLSWGIKVAIKNSILHNTNLSDNASQMKTVASSTDQFDEQENIVLDEKDENSHRVDIEAPQANATFGTPKL